MNAVWCADETFLDQLIYLNESNLVLDSPKDEKAEEIKYKSGNEVEETTLQLASPEVRDDVYQALKSCFGDKFTETEDAYSTPQAAYGSLMALTIFGILTWGGANFAAALRAADEYEISGSKQGLKYLALFAIWFVVGSMLF